MERSKKSLLKIKILLILMFFTIIFAITSTYAWFSSQREVEISGMKLNVEVAESMQISLDGAKWYQSITIDNMRQFYGTYADTTKPQADKNTNTNYVPTELIPVSTVGEVSSGKLQFMTGSSTMSGLTTSAALTACSETDLVAGADIKDVREANNENHPYLVFDMYLRNYSSNESDELQLNGGSSVWVDTWTAETQEGKGKYNTGLENCARVGFVVYDNTADITATATNIRGLTATTPQVVIWEPNSEQHISEVILAGRATAQSENTTYGVKYNTSGATIPNVYATSGDNISEQYTFKPEYEYVATTMTTASQTPSKVTIEANKVTKVRVYIWIEGQDVDCINTASQGDRLQATIKLTKPDNDKGTENTYGETTTLASVSNTNIGDYIDLGNNIVGTESTTDDWRILYVEGNTIYAILSDYLPNSTEYATNAGLVTANTYNVYSNENRETLLNGLTTSTYWNGLANGISGATVTGTPTAELLLESYNTKNGTTLDLEYVLKNAERWNTSSLYNPRLESIDRTEGYWLATLCDVCSWECDHVCFMIDSGGISSYTALDDVVSKLTNLGVRPVISLPSNISATRDGNIWTVTR